MTYETSFSADLSADFSADFSADKSETAASATLERPRFFGGPAALLLPLALFVATTFALFS